MIKVIFLAIIGLILNLSALPTDAAAPGRLTETEVRQFMNQVNAAAQKRDHSKVLVFFAPDAAIKMTTQGQTKNLSRVEYYEMMEKGGANTSNYSYNATIQSIQIKQNRAVVVMTVNERISSPSFGALSSVAKETALVEKRNGKLYMTQLAANIMLLPGL